MCYEFHGRLGYAVDDKDRQHIKRRAEKLVEDRWLRLRRSEDRRDLRAIWAELDGSYGYRWLDIWTIKTVALCRRKKKMDKERQRAKTKVDPDGEAVGAKQG